MPNLLDNIIDAARKASPVAPQSGEAAGMKAKKENIDSYRKAVAGPTNDAPKASPAQEVDKINPKAKFGDRKPEKRLPADQWAKPLASYKNGTPYVPETGPAILHKGEAVKTAGENMADIMSMVPGNKVKPPKKELAGIFTRKAGKGFIHEHHDVHPEHHKMKEHASGNMKDALTHINDHLGDGSSVEDAMAAPAPDAAGAPAAPAV